MRLIKRSPPVNAPASRAKARAAAQRKNNGLAGAALHAADIHAPRRKARSQPPPHAPAGGRAIHSVPLKSRDPETSARHYLDHALESVGPSSLARPVSDAGHSEFRSLGAETVPLTGTTMVKFRQTFNKIPVYGSLVTVELDKRNKCVGINSSLGTPQGVSHIARLSPHEALAVAAKASGQSASKLTNTPALHYYFHLDHSTWRLAYIIKSVPQRKRKVLGDGRSDAVVKDYVVDARTGKLLAALPRTSTVAVVTERAKDGLRASRVIAVENRSGRRELRDVALNVTTYDFGFQDPSRESRRLPGTIGSSPPAFPVEAVAAHANAAAVARFLRRVLKRNNIDNRGGEMISSVNCWDRQESRRPAREWKNAYWNEKQMVYGQVRFPDGSLYSIANMLEVVGHEMFHGVTDHTARLEYRTQPGALNESYSDIFGTIIANYGKPLSRWRWDIGTGFAGPGTVLRSLKDPTEHRQPKLMRNFQTATPPFTFKRNDYGHVHGNSGIHNYAAYRVMTARSGGKYVFSPSEIAAMFYIALTQHLSRTSSFVDSRRAVLQAAQSLFRSNSGPIRNRKIRAVKNGFAAAGIV
jgi:Zn-dependent metalloprotease